MAVKTRIDSVSRDIGLIVDDMLSPAAQGRSVAAFAREAIAEADATNKRILGRVPPRTITVDGRQGAALESVKAVGGSIITEWELIGDVLVWIGNALRDRSPVLSGKYRDSHTLFANGSEIEIGGNVPQSDEYVFLNPLPYARKIEMGKTKSGRDFVVQVPNRIYERTAKDARSRFGNLANIKSVFRAVEGSSILAYVASDRSQVRSKNGRFQAGSNAAAMAYERERRVPAILVTLKAN